MCERVGDHVTIRKDNAWQIKVNSQLGTIDSWKVGSVHSGLEKVSTFFALWFSVIPHDL